MELCWENNKNKFNSFVNWDSLIYNKRKLLEIAGLLKGQRVAAILKNYTIDYKFWNHGMPDLVLWDDKTKRIKFSEVKS